MTIGTRLRAARDAQGLNQTDFAAACGVSKNAQYGFEKDQNLPGSAYLLKLGELGVDVHHVLFGRPGAMTPEEAVLLNAFRAAEPKARHALLAQVLMGQSAVSAPAQTIKGDNHGQQVGGNVTAERQTFNVGTRKR